MSDQTILAVDDETAAAVLLGRRTDGRGERQRDRQNQ